MQLPETNCARARESLSAQLDGELPELDVDRLEAHLLVCPDCSQWAEQVRGLTALLREAPLEEPAGRFVLPRVARGWRVGSAVAVASAAAVVATMFGAPGQQASSNSLGHASGYVGVSGRHYVVSGRHYVVSRLTRLADGVFTPVSPGHGFRHV